MKTDQCTTAPIPVTIVTGFLGAGKTTLLNHILTAEHGIRIGVLVNDFGSINVDADLISEVEDGVVSLANGCVCCSIRVDLIQAVLKLTELAERPEHIIIEASGVADPAGIVDSFQDPAIWRSVFVDGIITVVDADQALAIPEEEQKLARAQLAGADMIILNKVDLVEEQTVDQVRAWIAAVRPGVQIFQARECQVPMAILLGAIARNEDSESISTDLAIHVHEVGAENPNHHAPTHDLMFDTWSYTSSTPMRLNLLNQVLAHLPGTLFRAKGFIHAKEKPLNRVMLQLVGKRATLTATEPWGSAARQTRLVFIARHGGVNFPALEKALVACEPEDS